jgi:hypothetical protein
MSRLVSISAVAGSSSRGTPAPVRKIAADEIQDSRIQWAMGLIFRVTSMRIRAAGLVIAFLISHVVSPVGAQSAPRKSAAQDRPPVGQALKLTPHYTTGQVMRYQMEVRVHATTNNTSPVADPESARALDRSTSMTVRLEVLSIEDATQNSMGRVHIRSTYEKVSVASAPDAFDPEEEKMSEQIRKLEGGSVEFVLEPDGKVTNFTATKEINLDPSSESALRDSFANLSPQATLPPEGVSLGKTWSTERPLQFGPLAGLAWHSDSTYVRDEPCFASDVAADKSLPVPPTQAGENCAVVLTQLHIVRNSKPGEQTPPEYLRDGLRTYGDFTGTAESLTAISLKSGLVARVTQTGKQDLNFVLSKAAGNVSIHYSGHVESQTQLRLLPSEK